MTSTRFWGARMLAPLVAAWLNRRITFFLLCLGSLISCQVLFAMDAYNFTFLAVTFIVGCSFTFESALLAGGVPVAHIEQGVNVPMYRTNRRCEPAGAIGGPLVGFIAAWVLASFTLATFHASPMWKDAFSGKLVTTSDVESARRLSENSARGKASHRKLHTENSRAPSRRTSWPFGPTLRISPSTYAQVTLAAAYGTRGPVHAAQLVEDRVLVRRKTYDDGELTFDEAAFDMEQLVKALRSEIPVALQSEDCVVVVRVRRRDLPLPLRVDQVERWAGH